MNERDQVFFDTWQKHRQRGKTMYMVGYAVIYAAITATITLLFRAGDAPISELLTTGEFLTKLLIFTAVGLTFAHFKWKSGVRKHEELKRYSKQKVK